MSTHVARDLEQSLHMNNGALGFLEFVDEQAVSQLNAAVRQHLEEQSQILDAAVTDAGERLPVGLGNLTTGILA